MDEIFEMVMKEARSRPGDDLILNVRFVMIELRIMVKSAIDDLVKEEIRRIAHLDKIP